MTFHVSLTNDADQHYADEDKYEFLESGVLAIHRGDDTLMDEYFAPHAWERVEATHAHGPGVTGGPEPDILDTIG
jgi:hypothetical protein